MTDTTAGAAQPAVNAAQTSQVLGLLCNTIAQQIACFIANTALAACAVVTTRRRPGQRHYRLRESFIEDAAMSREMFRL